MGSETELEDLAREDIARSGLTIDDIAGAQVLDHVAARAAVCRDKEHPVPAGGAYSIPYYDLDGKPILENGPPFRRIRLLDLHEPDGPRYLSPPGSTSHVYIPAQFKTVLEVTSDSVVVLTEGEKKAIAGCKAGVPTLALPGIQMYRNTLGRDEEARKELLPELKSLLERLIAEYNIQTLVVLFDSDGEPLKKGDVPEQQRDLYVNQDGKYIANPDVYFAVLKIAKLVRETFVGLKVAHGWVMSASEGKGRERRLRKRGLDDLLVDTHPDGPKAYRALLKPLTVKARPAPPAATGGFLPLGITGDSKQVVLWSLYSDMLVTEPLGNLTKQPHLCNLLGQAYFEANYSTGVDKEGNPKFDTARAGRDISGQCTAKGVFSEKDRVRGCGVWHEPGIDGLVIARKDGVVDKDGQPVPRMDGDRKHIYTAQGDTEPPEYLVVDDRTYIDLVRRLSQDLRTWEYQYRYGPLLVIGWILSQVFLGALEARPGIWLISPRGTGKSTLLRYIRSALGDYAWLTDMAKDSSAAGIRQALETSAAPCVVDEMETAGTAQSQAALQNMAGLLSLMRSSYSATGNVRKGTADQKGRSYRIITGFAMGSISDPTLDPADASRIVKIYLRKRPKAGDPPAHLSDEESRQLFWGTIQRYGAFKEALKTLKKEWQTVCPGGDAREADTFGTLIAAAQATGLFKQLPVVDVAREVMADMAAQVAEAREAASEAEMFFEVLCSISLPVEQNAVSESGTERVQRVTDSVGQAIWMALHHEDRDYVKALARVGLAVKLQGSTPHLAVAARHPELAALLKGTRWSTNGSWVAALRESMEDGADAKSKTLSIGGVYLKVYLIPLSMLPVDSSADRRGDTGGVSTNSLIFGITH